MKKQILISIIVFAVFYFFRFYNIEHRVSFGWDQEQPAYQIKQLIQNYKPILLGPRVVGDKGFFLAPYYTYILVPFFLLSKLHPWAYLFFLLTYNMFFFFISLDLLKKIFDFNHAVFFLLFWSINPMMAHYDVTSWNPIFIPLLIMTTFWLMKKIGVDKHDLYYIFFGLLLGVGINMHFQFIFILFFSTFFLIISRKLLTLKKLILLIASFIFTFFPLLVFDLRHNFLNINLFINFFTEASRNTSNNIFSWIPVFTNFLEPIIYFKSQTTTFLFYLLAITILVILIKRTQKFLRNFYISVLFLWLIFPFGFAKYGQRPSEYYFIFLYPFMYIIIINFFQTLKKSYFLYLFLIIMMMINLNKLKENFKSDNLSLIYRDKLIKNLIPLIKNKKFNISYTVPLGRDTGFKYLIEYYGIKQTNNWSDPLIQIKIPADQSCQLKSGEMGIFIPPELR